jgi:hypothetical protein
MKRIAMMALLLFGSAAADAQIDIIGWNMPTGSGIPSGFDTTIEPYIDGVTIPITWESTCVLPCTSTSGYTFAAFYTSILPYISGMYSTCGKSLPGRGAGHPCIINIDARPVSNPTINSDTPTWVFSTAWAGSNPPVDAAFCGTLGGTMGYPGSTPAGGTDPAPPYDTSGNVSSGNCGGMGGTLACTVATIATGIPAVWEYPYQQAVQGWWTALIAWASNSTTAGLSQIDYIRFGFSIGSEATINCTQSLENAAGGGDALMKSKWLGAYATAASYISSQRSLQSPVPRWVPMMTVNMGQSLTSYPGGTDPSWTIGEAQTILANQPFAIGTQGLENGTPGTPPVLTSDLLDIQLWNTCTGANCCSDNWCNVRQMVIGQVPYIELQDCNISLAGGGNTNCLDSQDAGTGARAQTLSQVFVLSSEQGTTSAEIYYQDLQCAVGISSATNCTAGIVPPAYLAAITALAAGQPPAAASLVGAARATGGVQIF